MCSQNSFALLMLDKSCVMTDREMQTINSLNQVINCCTDDGIHWKAEYTQAVLEEASQNIRHSL